MSRTSVLCAVLALLAITGPVVKAQNTTSNYTNIMAALSGRGLTGLASLIRLAGLDEDLSDPDLDITLFAPSNAAIADATAQLTQAQVNITAVVPVILTYHACPNNSIPWSDGISLPTFLSGQNLTVNTTTTITVLQVTNNTYYLGGIIPGAQMNLTSKITAGKSVIYVIDGVLVPPSALFGVPLTIADFLATTPNFSILNTLVRNDSLLRSATSDPNLAITLFAPPNDAFNAVFRATNLSVAALSGTATARRILLNHIYADYPAMAADVPFGVNTFNSASNVTGTPDTLTFNKTRNGTSFAITVRGGGNPSAIPVVNPDIPAGMSAIHVIAGVILPRPANATNTTVAGK